MRKKIIIISIIILFVMIGAGVGIFFWGSAKKPQAEIPDTEAKYQTTLTEAPRDGTNPSDHTVEENVAYALWTVANTNEFYTVTTGTAKASIATQSVYNMRVVKDGKAMVTMISNGLVKSAKQRYFTTDKVFVRDATKILSDTEAKWIQSEPECVSYKTIKQRYGWLPFEATGYIICHDTYINLDEMTMVENEDHTFTLSFDLDPEGEKAPFWYRREVRTNGGSTIIPEFYSIHVNMTINSNWQIVKNDIQESYKVKSKGVEAVTKTKCSESFFYENVNFDADALAYFDKYSYMSALDDNTGEDDNKLDAADIIVESLQKSDGTDTVLELQLDIDDFKTSGLAALNITDLSNINVALELDQLYVEYSDSIYISLGGLKVKANINELSGIISKITDLLPKTENEELSIDADQLLKDLSSSKIEESENKVIIDSELNIAGITIPIHFVILHENDKYSLESANVSLNVFDKNITLDVKASNKTIQKMDHQSFMNLANIEFLVDDVKDIILNKSVDLEIKMNYQSLDITLNGTIDFNESINASFNVLLENNDKSLEFRVDYQNDVIYFAFSNLKLKITKDDLIRLINKYSNSDSLGFDLASLDIEGILTKAFSIDYSRLLEEVILTENSLDITLGLKEIKDTLEELKLSLKDTEYGLSGYLTYKDFRIDLKVGSLGYEIKPLTDDYNNLAYLEGIIDDVLAIYNNKKLAFDLNLNYKSFALNGNGILDFNDSLCLYLSLELKDSSDKSMNLEITYLNDTAYLKLGNTKLKITKDDLLSIISLFTDLNTQSLKLDVETIINTIFSIDYDKLIKNLTIEEDLLDVSVDISQFVSFIGNIKATIKEENGLNINLESMDINASLTIKETDESVEIDDTNYNNLGYLYGFINDVLVIYNSKKMAISVDLTYDEIKANASGILDLTNGIALDLLINLTYDDASLAIKVTYLNEEFYLSYSNLNFKISISDMKNLLAKYGNVKLDTNIDLSVEGILKTILSLDFDKIIQKLSIEENVLGIDLDLSDFVKSLDKVSVIINREDVLSLSIKSIFEATCKIEKTNEDIILEDKTYYDLMELESTIAYLLELYNDGKLELNLDFKYKDLQILASGIIQFKDSLGMNLDLTVIYNSHEYKVNIAYVEDVLYLSAYNLNVKITKDDLLKIIKNFTDFDLSNNIDIKGIVKTIVNIDMDKLINELVLEDSKLSILADLSAIKDDLSSLQLELKKEDNISLDVAYLEFLASLNVSKTNKDITLPEGEYNNLGYLMGVFDDVLAIYNSKKMSIDLSLAYKDIEAFGNAILDFGNSLKAKANITVKYKDLELEVVVTYLDDIIYLSLDNINLKIKKDDLLKIISKVTKQDDSNNILSKVLKLDFSKIIDSLVISDSLLKLDLNLEELSNKLSTISLELNKDNDINAKLSLNDILVNLRLNNTTSNVELENKTYYDVMLLEGILDDILVIADSKKLDLNLEFTYKEILVKVSGKLDFENGIKAKANVLATYKEKSISLDITYINDTLYLSFNNANIMVKKDDLLSIISLFMDENSNESILDKLLKVDFDKLIKSLEIMENDLKIVLDLNDLISFIHEVSIELQDDLSLTVSLSDLFDISASLKNTDDTIILVDKEYQDLGKLINVFALISKMVDSKKLELELSLDYKDLSLSGNAYLDLNNDKIVSLILNLKYKELDQNINVYYLGKYNDLTNVILVDLGSNHVLIPLEGILQNTGEIDINSVIDFVFSLDFAKIIVSLLIEEDNLDLVINLSDFNKLKDIIDIAKNIKLTVKKENDTLKLVSEELLNISVSCKEYGGDIIIPSYTYTDLSNLVDDIFTLVSWISTESFRISLNGTLDIKNINITLDGYLDFILDSNKNYAINGYINMLVMNTRHDIYVKYQDKVLFVEYGGITIGLDLTDIKGFIEEIMTTLKLDNKPSIDFGKLNNVVDTLAIEEQSVSFNLKDLIDLITTISLSFDYIDSLEKFSVPLTGNEINISLGIEKISSYQFSVKDNYLNNDDLLSLVKTVRKILDIIEKKSFNVNVDLTVYKDGYKYLDVVGNLGIIIDKEDGEKFTIDDLSFKVNLSIKEYNADGSMKVNHVVDLKLVNDKIYIIYSTKNNSYLKFVANKGSILSALASLTKVLGLDIDFFNEYLHPDMKNVNIEQLTDLFTKESKEINVSSIINSLVINPDGLTGTISAKALSDVIPDDKVVSFNLVLNDTIPFDVSVLGLYADYVSESEYKKIDINSISLTNDSFTIEAPSSTSGYYDLSEIDELLNGLLTTGSNKDYSISSSVVLDVLGILKPTVEIDARVRVLEDGSPLVYLHMSIPQAGVSVGRINYKIYKKEVYFYYKDTYVYIYRVDNSGDTYKLKITYEEFFSDIIYYLLDFAMGMPDGIMSKINSSATDESYVIDAGGVINSYSYSNHSFNVNLDMQALTGNSNLGDMSFKLVLNNMAVSKNEETDEVNTAYALTEIANFNFNLVTVINIESSSIGLTNIKEEGGYKWFTTIDMDDVYNYIDSYTYGVDMVYKNGSYMGKRNHTITFIMNYLDPESYSGQAGMPIKFPEIDVISYDDKHYAFDGWYLDKYLTEPFTDTTISNKSLKVYAKFREVNAYKLYINSIDGNTEYDVYDGVSLNEYLEKPVYTDSSGKTYRLLGYSLTDSGEIVDVSVMPKSDYTLYAIWEEIEYKLYVDGLYYQTLNESSTISLTGDYELKANDMYFGFDSSQITYDTLVNMYGNYAVIDGNQAAIYLETKANRNGYYTVTFEYDYNKFNYKRYNSVSLKNDVDFDSELLPNGLYNDMNINYWYNDDYEYHNGNIQEIAHSNTTLYAYYATCKYLSYGFDSSSGEDLFSVNGFDYSGSQSITIVLPKYVESNGEYYIVQSLAVFGENDEKYTVFSSKTNLYAIYFNEGFEVIGANAFKNCTSLTKVYFSSTIKSVASDSFYMDSESTAKKVRFYLSQSSTLSTSGWYGFKSSGSYKNYGTKNSGFLGIGSYDLSNAFNHYNGRIENIIHALY